MTLVQKEVSICNLLHYFSSKPGITEDRGGRGNKLLKFFYDTRIPIYYSMDDTLRLTAVITQCTDSVDTVFEKLTGANNEMVAKHKTLNSLLPSAVEQICLEVRAVKYQDIDQFYRTIISICPEKPF